MTVTEVPLTRNSDYQAEVRVHDGLAAKGAQEAAVVACMDSRVDVFANLRLAPGKVHVIRNAGNVVTEDMIRSLMISQRLMGAEEVILIHHIDYGVLSFTDEEPRRALEEETGTRPTWEPGAFTDLADDIRRSATRIKSSPLIPHTDAVHGFILDLATGRLAEVDAVRA